MQDSFDFMGLLIENIITERPICIATLFIVSFIINGPFIRARVPNLELLSSKYKASFSNLILAWYLDT